MLFRGLFARGAVAEQTNDRAFLQAMLDVELALCRALIVAGLAPPETAEQLEAVSNAEDFDLGVLGDGAGEQGTPVPALLKELRARLGNGQASEHLHQGATSQDVLDTAMVLVVKRSARALLEDLSAAADRCAVLAERHRNTVMPGRTLLQQGAPITFGLKAAGWMSALDDCVRELRRVHRELPLQFGGAVGTMAALEQRGPEVARALAEELGLALPPLPWHTDRVLPARIACSLALATGAMGKVARDVTLLAQSEVAELREGAGAERGGSSAMPHKRNPVGAIAVLACAQQAPGLAATLLAAMVQEHERGAGGWQAEWPSLGVLLRLTGSAASSLRTVLEEAELDAERMRANISEQSMSESVTVALAKVTDPRQARSAVAEAAARASSAGRSFREVLLELDPVRDKLGSDGLDRALDPASYLGATKMLIDAALHARADMRDDDE